MIKRITETAGSWSFSPVAQFGGEAEMSNITTSDPLFTLFGSEVPNTSSESVYNAHPEYNPQVDGSSNENGLNFQNILNDFNSFFPSGD